MQDPASPPEHTLTCPRCSSPVEPGIKFCPACGTKIPVLFTCSKCGTQFIHPSEQCNLCGGPLILEEVPEPESSPEYAAEDDTRPVRGQTPERDAADIPEHGTDSGSEQFEEETTGPVESQASAYDEDGIPLPGTDEVPDDHTRETIIPDKQRTPPQYTEEIQEPDTDELLEEFGKEYDEDETLDSRHTPKTPSLIKPQAQKAVTAPALPGRGSSETVDDALFLSPKKPESPAKPRGNTTWIIIGAMVLIAIVAAGYFIGLPMLSALGNSPASNASLPEPAGNGTVMPTLSGTSNPASGALVPQPTQTILSVQKIYFSVRKNPVTARITVSFAGSAGEGSISSAEVRVTHPDGSVSYGMILPLKGVAEIMLKGSTETDRVEIIAQMYDGRKYRVYDELVPLMGV